MLLGALLARRVALPAGSLLVPLILAGALVLAVPGLGFAVPPLLREAGFALIGLQVGLRFTAATLREIGALVGPVLRVSGQRLGLGTKRRPGVHVPRRSRRRALRWTRACRRG